VTLSDEQCTSYYHNSLKYKELLAYQSEVFSIPVRRIHQDFCIINLVFVISSSLYRLDVTSRDFFQQVVTLTFLLLLNSLRCPPRTFIPALCRIFLDESAPDNVLEVTARAVTYYLDVSAECTRRIVAVEGTIKAICNRLVVVEASSRTSKDLAEQCIKVRLLCFLKHSVNIRVIV
jgi:hypothetical protein